MPAVPWTAAADGVVIDVRLTPRSGRDAIEGVAQRAGRAVLTARVRAAPADGEANQSLCRLIAGVLDIAPGNVTITAGAASRMKRIRVKGQPAAIVAVLRRLATESA